MTSTHAQPREAGELVRLSRLRAAGPTVLSLFVTVPLDPAQLRGLPTRIDELMSAAAGGPRTAGPGRLAEKDRRAIHVAAVKDGRDWLGRTMAVFTCADLGLFEVAGLRTPVPERAVLADRPHIRPLLAARQWCPDYRIAVVDSRHAWLFAVAGDDVTTTAAPDGVRMPSTEFGGWYGLETRRVHHRVIQFDRRHYQDTAALLEQAVRDSGPQPLVIAGHEEQISAFYSFLHSDVRKDFAGSFAVDPHAVTPARVRALAQPVVERWADRTARGRSSAILGTPPGGPAAVGLPACLAAVGRRAVTELVLPGDGLVPGHACPRCGQLSVAAACPAFGGHGQPLPDLLDEMARRTVCDGGTVTALRGGTAPVVARLRFRPAP